MIKDPGAPRGAGVLVRPRVCPNASTTGLGGFYGESALRLNVAVPPAGGEANAALERSVAGKVGAEPSRVRVVGGPSGRDKTVFVGAERAREARAPRPL